MNKDPLMARKHDINPPTYTETNFYADIRDVFTAWLHEKGNHAELTDISYVPFVYKACKYFSKVVVYKAPPNTQDTRQPHEKLVLLIRLLNSDADLSPEEVNAIHDLYSVVKGRYTVYIISFHNSAPSMLRDLASVRHIPWKVLENYAQANSNVQEALKNIRDFLAVQEHTISPIPRGTGTEGVKDHQNAAMNEVKYPLRFHWIAPDSTSVSDEPYPEFRAETDAGQHMQFPKDSYILVPENRTLYLDNNWMSSLKVFNNWVFSLYCPRLPNNQGFKKIGELSIWKKSEDRTTLFDLADPRKQYDSLPDSFLTIGSEDFYKTLQQSYYSGIKDSLLKSLNDFPYECNPYTDGSSGFPFKEGFPDKISDFHANIESLIRLSHNLPPLTNYRFKYMYPYGGSKNEASILFEVENSGEKLPPPNMQAIIGSNGCGKTTLLRNIASACLQRGNNLTTGSLSFDQPNVGYAEKFKHVVYISFSTLDPIWDSYENGMFEKKPFDYIGYLFNASSGSTDVSAPTRPMHNNPPLYSRFNNALKHIYENPDTYRLLNEVLDTLKPVSHFNEILALFGDNRKNCDITDAFRLLSAGHKSVLYTLVRLIDLNKDNTLVLFDEPEAHLHPPLLAGFMRALSIILVAQNNVGMLATHSAVVLQEIPRKCVWVLRRDGQTVRIDHPPIETFGESLSVINNDVFGYEVNGTGYHNVLDKVARSCRGGKGTEVRDQFKNALDMLNNQLGEEGRSVLLSLLLTMRDSE